MEVLKQEMTDLFKGKAKCVLQFAVMHVQCTSCTKHISRPFNSIPKKSQIQERKNKMLACTGPVFSSKKKKKNLLLHCCR